MVSLSINADNLIQSKLLWQQYLSRFLCYIIGVHPSKGPVKEQNVNHSTFSISSFKAIWYTMYEMHCVATRPDTNAI